MQHTFRIGEAYHVEPSLNRVIGPGGSLRIEPKVMLVLVCLADHPGQVVPKDRLFHAAWPDTAVGDDVLTRAISELRRLFEDDPKQPRVIETIPKSGYRLIAPVLLSAQEDIAPATLPTNGTPSAADLLPGLESRAAVTGEDRTLGRLEKFEHDSLPSGFAVSPDGQSVLSQAGSSGTNRTSCNRGVPVTGMCGVAAPRRAEVSGARCGPVCCA